MASVRVRVCVLLPLILLLLAPVAARKFGVTTDDNGTPVLEEGDVQAKDPTNIVAKPTGVELAPEPPKPVLEVPTAPPGVSGPPGNGKKTAPGLTKPQEYLFIEPGDKPAQAPKSTAKPSTIPAPSPKQPAEAPDQKDPQFHLPTKKDTTVPLPVEDTAPPVKKPETPLSPEGKVSPGPQESAPSEKGEASLPKEEAPPEKSDPPPQKEDPPAPLPPKKNDPPAPKKLSPSVPAPPERKDPPSTKKADPPVPAPEKKDNPPVSAPPKKDDTSAPKEKDPPVLAPEKKNDPPVPAPPKKNNTPGPKKNDLPVSAPPKKTDHPSPSKKLPPAPIPPKKNDTPAPKKEAPPIPKKKHPSGKERPPAPIPPKKNDTPAPKKKAPPRSQKKHPRAPAPPKKKPFGKKGNNHPPRSEFPSPPKKEGVPPPRKKHSAPAKKSHEPPREKAHKHRKNNAPRHVPDKKDHEHTGKPHYSRDSHVELIPPDRIKSQWEPQHDYIIPKGFECVNFGPVRQAGMVQYKDSDITGQVSTYAVPHQRYPKLPTAFLSHVFGKDFTYSLHTAHKNRQRTFDLIVGFAEVYPRVCGGASTPRKFSMKVGFYSMTINAEARVGCGKDLKIPIRSVASEGGKIQFSFKALSQNAMLSLICYSPTYVPNKRTGHTYIHSDIPVTHVTSNENDKAHKRTTKSNKVGVGKIELAKPSSSSKPSTATPSEKPSAQSLESNATPTKNTNSEPVLKANDIVVDASPSPKNDEPIKITKPPSGETVDTIDTLAEQKGVNCINFGSGAVNGLDAADSSAFTGHVTSYKSTAIVKGTSLSGSFNSHVFGKKFSYALKVPKMSTYALGLGFAETFNLACNSSHPAYRTFQVTAGSQSKVMDILSTVGCSTAHTVILRGVKSLDGSVIKIGFEAIKNNAMLSNLCYWDDTSELNTPTGNAGPEATGDATPSAVVPASSDGPVIKEDLSSASGTAAESPSPDVSASASSSASAAASPSVSASVAASPSSSASAKPTKEESLKQTLESPLPKVNPGILEDTQGGHGPEEATTKEDGQLSGTPPADLTPSPSAKASSAAQASPLPKGSSLPKVTTGVIEDTQGGHGTGTNILIFHNSSMLDVGDGGKSNGGPMTKDDVSIAVPMSVSPTPSTGAEVKGNPDVDGKASDFGAATPVGTVAYGNPDAAISATLVPTPADVVIVLPSVATPSASNAPSTVINDPSTSPASTAEDGSAIVITIPSASQGTSSSESPSQPKASDDVAIVMSPAATPSIINMPATSLPGNAESGSDVVISIPISSQGTSANDSPSSSQASDDVAIVLSPIASPSTGKSASSGSDIAINIPILDAVPSASKNSEDVVISIDNAAGSSSSPTASSTPVPPVSSGDVSGGIVVPSIVDKKTPHPLTSDNLGDVEIIIPPVSPPTPSADSKSDGFADTNGGIVVPSIVDGNNIGNQTTGEQENIESVIPLPSVSTTGSKAEISSAVPTPSEEVVAIPQPSSSSSALLHASPSNTESPGTHDNGGAETDASNEDNGITIVLPVSSASDSPPTVDDAGAISSSSNPSVTTNGTVTPVPQPAESPSGASVVTAVPQPPIGSEANNGSSSHSEDIAIAIPFSDEAASNGENPSNSSQVLIGIASQSPVSTSNPAPEPFAVQNQVGFPILGDSPNTTSAVPVAPSGPAFGSPAASSTTSASPSPSISSSASPTLSSTPSASASSSMSSSVSPSATPALPMSMSGGTQIITINSSPLPSGSLLPPLPSRAPMIVEVPDKTPAKSSPLSGTPGQTNGATAAPTAVLVGKFSEVVGTNKESSNAFAVGMGILGSLLVLMLMTCLYFAIFAGRSYSNSQSSQYTYPRDDGPPRNDYAANLAPDDGFIIPTGYEDDADLRITSSSVASDPVYQNVENGNAASGQIYEQEANEFDPYDAAAGAAAVNPESAHGSQDPYSLGAGGLGLNFGHGAVGSADEARDSFELPQEESPVSAYDMQQGQHDSFEENHSIARPARFGVESSGNEERQTISTENDDMYSDYGDDRPAHVNGKTNSQHVRDQLANIHHQIASRIGVANSQSSSDADDFTPRQSQGSEGHLLSGPHTLNPREERHSNSTEDDNDTNELCYKSICDDGTQQNDAMGPNDISGGNDPWPHWYNAPRAGPHASTHYRAGMRNQVAPVGGPDLLASVREKLIAAQLPAQHTEVEEEATNSSWIARKQSVSTGQPTSESNAPEKNGIFRAPTLAQRWPENKAEDENSSVAGSAKYSDVLSSQSSGRQPLGPANNANQVDLVPPKPVPATLQDISSRPVFNQDMLTPSSGIEKVAALFGGAEAPKVELGAVGSVPFEAVDPEKNRYSQRFGQGRASAEPVVPVDVAELRKRREPNVKEAARRLSAATHVTTSSAQSSELR